MITPAISAGTPLYQGISSEITQPAPERVNPISYLLSGGSKFPGLEYQPSTYFVHGYFSQKNHSFIDKVDFLAFSNNMFQGARPTTQEEYEAIEETFRRTAKSSTARKNRK